MSASSLLDPADHSPDARAGALAAILAAGVLRLRRPAAPPSAPEKSPESLPNELAVSAKKSVTIHAG